MLRSPVPACPERIACLPEADEPLPSRRDLNLPEYRAALPAKTCLAERALGPTEALTETMASLWKPANLVTSPCGQSCDAGSQGHGA